MRKGTMVLERKVNKIASAFGVKVFMGDKFEYGNGIVSFTPFYWDTLSKAHCDYVNRTFSVDVSGVYFLFCLLHEIGHHFTVENFSDEELENEIILRQLLDFSEEDAVSVNDAYFNLPAEEEATKWALEFMLNHVNWVNSTSRFLDEAIRHYFKVNGWV